MKNIESRQNFLNKKNTILNEGVLGALKNLVKGASNLYKKVKGGKDLQKIKDETISKIDSVFANMTKAEQEKSATDKNIKAQVESKVFEAEEGSEDVVNTPKQTGQELTPSAQLTKQQEQQEEMAVKSAPKGEEKNQLSKEQINQQIKLSKERVKQLSKTFDTSVNALKKKYTNNDGSISKKLEYSIELAKGELSDYIFQKWEGFFNSIGNNKAIQNIQKQRANVAKEMKTNSDALKKMVDEGDKAKSNFVIDKKYKYTNSSGEVSTITVKEVDNKGNVSRANTKDGREINPYSDKIEEYYNKGDIYTYDGSKGEIEVTILGKTEDGKIQVKSKNSTFIATPSKLGYKVEKSQPQAQKQPKK